VGAVSASQLLDRRDRVLLGGVDGVVRAEFARHAARFLPDINGDHLAGAGQPGNLQAFESHAPLTEDRHAVADLNPRGRDGGDAVTERLQTRGFAVGDTIIYSD